MNTSVSKDVTISILGLQEYEDINPDSIELTTGGKLTVMPYGYHLSYWESELTGMEGTLTSFQISPGRIVLTRTGTTTSEMVFEQGVRHLSLYNTPYGQLEIGVFSRAVSSTLDEHGGEIHVRYAIDIDHQLAGESNIHLKVRESAVSQ